MADGHGFITTTWPELVHAAITIGRRGWRDVVRHGRHSFLEMHYRAAMLLANLQNTNGSIVKTDAYKSLDRSEKGAVSYYLGLTVAGLAARRFFNVSWPMHLDVYHHLLHPELSGSLRPDLVGLDRSGAWCVIEAKGRSNEADRRLLPKAKRQTRMLRRVCGQKPLLRIASVAYFSPRGSLSLRLADPTDHDRHADDWDFTENQFFRDYYQSFVNLLNRNDGAVSAVHHSDGQPILVTALPDVDMRIGLARTVYELVTLRDPALGEVSEALGHGPTRFPEHPFLGSSVSNELPSGQDGTFLGTDGVLVQLGSSWMAG